MKLEPLICMPTAWTSVSGRFGVHLFEGRVTPDDMGLMQTVGERWTAEHPGERVELVVVYPSDTRLSNDERLRMLKLIKVGEAHRTASATVILAEGLLASMQRSVLTGIMMLAPPPHPAKVFSNIPEAASWLLPHVQRVGEPGLTLPSLEAALNAHLAQFCARPYRPYVKTG
jgi:hypothetical protein